MKWFYFKKFFIHCSTSAKSARKQKATTSLFSTSAAICSFSRLSAWTPAVRQLDSGTLSGVAPVTHDELSLCAPELTLELVPLLPYACGFHPTVQTCRHHACPSFAALLETTVLVLPGHSQAFHSQGSKTWATYIVSKHTKSEQKS